MATQKFDAIIIGAGQGGTLAIELAKAGRKTALIERGHVGGTCINVGCTPTKTLIASAQVAQVARTSKYFGVQTGAVEIDWKRVRARKDAMVREFREGYESHLKVPHLKVFCGAAKFLDRATVEVVGADGKRSTLSAKTIVINTGTQNMVPKIDGLETVPWLDSTSVMEIEAVPEHLVVLGGGTIALEFGQMFRRLGARVTIIEKGPQLLPREDADVAESLMEILRDEGLKVLCNAQVQSVRARDNAVALKVLCDGKTRTIAGSHLLVAVGREPNTRDLNLEAAGVECDSRGFIAVNERLETGVPGIYAMGDVAGSPQFTHIAYDDFRILCANLRDGKARRTRDRLLTYTVFTDPQLGRVGLSESQAREKKLSFRVVRLPMTHAARAVETGATRGFWKVLVEDQTDRILGGSFLSLDGGEVMAVLQMAMRGGLKATDLRDMPIAHPTLAEAMNNLFLRLDTKA